MAAWKRAANLKDRIKDLRGAMKGLDAKGEPLMTQEEFGRQVFGVTDQAASDYERGASQPAVSKLEGVANKLQIPVTVFQDGGPMPSETFKRHPETQTRSKGGKDGPPAAGEHHGAMPAAGRRATDQGGSEFRVAAKAVLEIMRRQHDAMSSYFDVLETLLLGSPRDARDFAELAREASLFSESDPDRRAMVVNAFRQTKGQEPAVHPPEPEQEAHRSSAAG